MTGMRVPAEPRGEVAERLKAADCKSARASVRWFESSPLHHPKSGSFLPLQLHSKNGMSPEYRFRRFHVVFLGFPPFSVGFDRLRATWLIHDETQIEFVSAGPQLHSLMSAFDPKLPLAVPTAKRPILPLRLLFA